MWNTIKVRIPKYVLSLCLLTAVSISGCYEEKSEYTINPDFSGKATFDLIFTPGHIAQSAPADAPEQLIKAEIERILKESKGIDTWKDISYDLTDEGSAHFTGTAYFPDINKLFLWRPNVTEVGGLRFSKDKSGRIIIELPHVTDPNTSRTKTTQNLSQADLTQQVRLARLHYNQARPMLQGAFSAIKQDSLLHLPAKIEKVSSFEKVNDTTVRYRMQGSQVIEAMDKLMADDERLKRLIREGNAPFEDAPDESLFNEILFGEEVVQVITNSNYKDLFDYDAEVAAARSKYDQMLEELKLDLTPPKPVKMPVSSIVSAKSGTVTVGGVRLIRYQDHERNIRPLNEFEKGYTLSLILELPDPNCIVVQGQIEKAMTDTGQDILPKTKRETSYPELSKDGRAAVFEVDLSLPEKEAKAIAELSGTLGYLKSAGSKKIDLGLMDFKKDAKSKVKGFYIRSVGVSRDREDGYMDLNVDLLRGRLKSTKFYREDGTELEVFQTGGSYSGDDQLDIRYTKKGPFPPKGRIVMEVIDEITKHEISFTLTNISLTGEPL